MSNNFKRKKNINVTLNSEEQSMQMNNKKC